MTNNKPSGTKMFVVFEILRDIFCISIYYASALSLHMESTKSMIQDCWIRNTFVSIKTGRVFGIHCWFSVWTDPGQWFFSQLILLRKPMRTDLLLCTCDSMANFSSSMHLVLKKWHKQDLKNIETVTRCRDSRSAKGGEQGRDDSIKQFSMQANPSYISLTVERYVGWSCVRTELFYAIIPIPCFPAFFWSAIHKASYKSYCQQFSHHKHQMLSGKIWECGRIKDNIDVLH